MLMIQRFNLIELISVVLFCCFSAKKLFSKCYEITIEVLWNYWNAAKPFSKYYSIEKSVFGQTNLMNQSYSF